MSGTTIARASRPSRRIRFNPRPALASGTTHRHKADGLAWVVSIRAPLSRAGRLFVFEDLPPVALFQSAPRSRERDDCRRERTRAATAVSIRAPLSRAGRLADPEKGMGFAHVSIRAPLSRAGRREDAFEVIVVSVVSIRAPLSRAGRHAPTRYKVQINGFQSAPRSRERDDDRHGQWLGKILCFNPRPALASGTTHTRRPITERSKSFNPRPALASGTTRHRRDLGQHRGVSIRAPLSRAGRREGLRQRWNCRRVSIRAPLSRAGRLDTNSVEVSMPVFQSAPRSRERDDWVGGGLVKLDPSFNPRPALASGTTR